MTEWKPILQGRASPGMKRLLGSARLDVPRSGGVARTVAALGLASGVTATAGVSAGASAVSASGAGASVLVKWLAIGAATGAVVTGTGEAVRYGIQSNRDARPVTYQTAAPAAPARRATAPRPASFPDVPAAREADPSPATDPDSRGTQFARPGPLDPGRPRERAAPPSALQPTLSEEVRALDAVRQLMAAGHARGALQALDDFSRRFPQPRLGPEAAVLREQARRLAQKP